MYGTPGIPTTGRPLPRITPLNKPFWDNTRNGVFSLHVCRKCGDRHIPESPVCPKCLSPDQAWEAASGKGTLESWVDFHRAYWSGFAEALPYRVCLVRLDEGPLFISTFLGSDAETRLGRRLRVVFEKITDEVTLPLFAPEEEQGGGS